METFETTQEVAARLGYTDGRIRQMLIAGYFPDAQKVGSNNRAQWLIPRNALPVLPEKNSEKTSKNT